MKDDDIRRLQWSVTYTKTFQGLNSTFAHAKVQMFMCNDKMIMSLF